MPHTPADGNEDGYTHLTYYHQPDLLSFVINELTFPIVNVCQGGYAEPVVDSFHLAQYSPNTPGNFENLTTRVFDFGVKAWLDERQSAWWNERR